MTEPLSYRADDDWTARCTARLRMLWPDLPSEQTADAAGELAQDPALRAMLPETVAEAYSIEGSVAVADGACGP